MFGHALCVTLRHYGNGRRELAVKYGVRSLTLARVGERACYSRGIVTHHFGSKQALLERLARATQSGFVPGLASLPPGWTASCG